MMVILILGLIFTLFIHNTQQSAGDQSIFYQRCVYRCGALNCTTDGFSFKPENEYEQPIYLSALQWSCEDECRYICMWRTVEAFHEENRRTPQFFGKWPFIRFFGMQEPASVFFSLMNLCVHIEMIKNIRKEFDSDTPFYWLWHAFCAININGWLCSMIFHSRDFPLTELIDYAGAFSIVLMSCYCMTIRLLKNCPRFLLVTITAFFLAFFINHIAYLSMGRFDYGYNMQLNILIGTFTAICWFGWCTYNRMRQRYVWKCAIFVALAGIVMLLEVIDRPPFFWIFDCHSLWHLSTAPLTYLFYSFVIDDCQYLRKQSQIKATKSEIKKQN